MSSRSWWSACKEVVANFVAHHPFMLAAALSYYTLLSMAPLLLLVVAIAGAVFGQQAARGELVSQIQGQLGQAGAQVVQTILARAAGPGQGILLIIGAAALLVGATTVFVQLQTSLNHIWGVKPKPARTAIAAWVMLRDRLLSLAMVLVIGLLLLALILIDAAINAARGHLPATVSRTWWFWAAVNDIVSLILIALLIAAIYKILPDVRIGWGKVSLGAALTAVLFWAGKFAIGWYLGRASIVSAYGAAGSIVALLVWVYYSSLIDFFGAEVTCVYARRTGGQIKPARHAVRVTQD